MAVPPFQEFMLPFLEFISDGKEHHTSELFEFLGKHFLLTEEDQKELLPSGRETRFKNRVYWARVYLGQAKLLNSTGRGRFLITERGQQLLKTKPSAEVRNFTGSLEGHGAQKGVLIATSKFTKEATEFAKRLQQKKLVLIDGEKFAELMVDFEVGVSRAATYTVQKIDPDYFELT
jgi:restriction endonuclease Mrr